jgi:peptidoglycan/xylan/chitin deacetylase (PgdA/CDA1 family)
MRIKSTCLIITAVLFNLLNVQAQSIDTLYEVATWRGFTKAAVSYTFDDGLPNQYTIAIPMLNEFGFQATFFEVIDWSPNWSSFQQAVNKGHEIGSHTLSHPHLGTLSDSLQKIELKNSQEYINSHIYGQECRTIAYPFCEPSVDSITRKYYFAARHCQGNIEKTTPVDFMNISSIVCGNLGAVNSTDGFNLQVNTAANSKGWVVYLIHALDTDNGYSPLSSTVLRQSLEYLDANRDKFWVSTFGNVAKYIRERNCVSVHQLEMYADSFLVEVQDTMDNSIFNYPISIRYPLPLSWPSAAAFQNGHSIPTSIMLVDTNKFIVFDAVPDSGTVLVKRDTLLPVVSKLNQPEKTNQEINVWVNNKTLFFTIPEDSGSSLNGKVINMNGCLVTSIKFNKSSESVGNINLADKELGSGIYFFSLSDGINSWSQKFLII